LSAVVIARHRGSPSRLAVLVLAAVTILALGERDVTVVHDIRAGAATILGPFEDAVTRVSRPLRAAWNEVADESGVEALRQENDELRTRVEELEAEAIAGADASRRLDELTQTLDLDSAGSVEQVAAQVTSGPRSNLSHAVEINKGSDAGLAVGMPAVTSAGLVGRLSQVSGGRATVELLTNPEFRVGVRLSDSGELGTARGQGRDEPLVVDSSIEPGTPVAEGIGVVTSGVDRSAYPDGLPVARVLSTREGAGGLSLELVVEPLVDVNRLSYVNILLWEPPE